MQQDQQWKLDGRPVCPVCEAHGELRAIMPVDSKTFRKTEHGAIFQCTHCSLGFVHPRPASTDAFYDLDAYYTQGRSHMIEALDTFGSRLRTHLAWRADRGTSLLAVVEGLPLRGRNLVDIGCGNMKFMEAAAAAGFNVVGVERDANAVQLSGFRVVQGSVEALPFAKIGMADVVVLSHVVEHLLDPLRAVQQCVRLLNPKGRIVIEVPNNQSLIARQSCLSWEHLDIPRHINFFSRRSLMKLADAAGLEAEGFYFSGFCRYFSPSYIATEQRIHDALPSVLLQGSTSKRNSAWRSWMLLARTAFARPELKYDSIGVVLRART